jgi:DNA repair photolyase
MEAKLIGENKVGNDKAREGDAMTMSQKPVLFRPSRTVLTYPSEAFQEKLLCDGLTLNLGDACVYSCSFCYVEAQMKKLTYQLLKDHNKEHGGNRSHEDVVIRRRGTEGETALEILSNQLAGGVKGWLSGRAIRDLKEQELVVYSSTLVDVGANVELLKETAKACQMILDETNWQVRLLTKGNLIHKLVKDGLVEDKTRPGNRLSHHQRMIFGFSTGTLNNKLAAAFERGTSLVSKRLESLHWLQDHGCRTFGMICPSLPQHDYDAFSVSMREALRPDKMEHVWAEVINVRGESFSKTRDALSSAGFIEEAEMLQKVSEGPDRSRLWEEYARQTFEAHAKVFGQKLRFLQYIDPRSRNYWAGQSARGAVLIGSLAKEQNLCSRERSAPPAFYSQPRPRGQESHGASIKTPGIKAAETRALNKAAKAAKRQEPVKANPGFAGEAVRMLLGAPGITGIMVLRNAEVIASGGLMSFESPSLVTCHELGDLAVYLGHEHQPDQEDREGFDLVLKGAAKLSRPVLN